MPLAVFLGSKSLSRISRKIRVRMKIGDNDIRISNSNLRHWARQCGSAHIKNRNDD